MRFLGALVDFVLLDDPSDALTALEQNSLALFDAWTERFHVTSASREFHEWLEGHPQAVDLTGS